MKGSTSLEISLTSTKKIKQPDFSQLFVISFGITLFSYYNINEVTNVCTNFTDQATFQATLISKCIQYARQLCTLLQYCCVDGVTGLEAIVQAFVVSVFYIQFIDLSNI